RALLAKPKLLLLDEASANLDEKTESRIAAEIVKLQGQCTTLIITHRPNFVVILIRLLFPAGHQIQMHFIIIKFAPVVHYEINILVGDYIAGGLNYAK